MPLTQRAAISGSLLLIAVAAGLVLTGGIYAGFAFSGAPTNAAERLDLALVLAFWIPILASWKFPRIGVSFFVVLFGIELIKCVDSHSALGECLRGFMPLEILGIPLILNVVFVERLRRRT